jgi:hypothetical protein
VNEFDANQNLLSTSGDGSPLGFVAVFHNLQPATTFFYQVCTGDAETIAVGCGPWNASSMQTLPVTITITGAQAFPARLVRQGEGRALLKSNEIDLTWEASIEVSGVDVEITSGGVTKGINIGGNEAAGLSGAVTAVPPNLGSLCEVRIRGQLPGGGVNVNFTPFSESVSIQDPANTHSVRTFFAQSGIDPSNGIRKFMPTTSFRSMMEI